MSERRISPGVADRDWGNMTRLVPERTIGAAGTASLVGREAEVAELAELLGHRWLVTLTGAPGVGKSWLAREVVTLLGARGVDVAVVDLAALCDPAMVAPAVAEGLDVEDASPTALAAAAVGGSRAVLLDDCDDVQLAAAEVAEALAAAGLVVLATSQRPLGIEGESLWRVPRLSLPSPDWGSGPDIGVGSEAVALFCERAGDVQRGFVLTANNAPAVAAICRRLEGLPLAIEAAAQRVALLSPAEVLDGLEEDPVAFLAAVHCAAPSHRSVWAAIEASLERLSARERMLWARLSVFAGGFELQAAQAVCGGEETAAEEVFVTLGVLLERSLVELDAACSPNRFRLFEPLRSYAAGRLQDADAAGLLAAHARWCLVVVGQAGDPDQGRRWLEALADEHENIEAASRWALSSDEQDVALELSRAHAYLCRAEARHAEARAAFKQVSSLAQSATDLCQAGGAAAAAGMADTAAARVNHGLTLAREAGDVAADAVAQAQAAMIATLRGEHGGDLKRVEDAVDLARTVDDEPCLIAVLIASGHAQLLVSQPTQARMCFEEALTMARPRGKDSATADALVGAGRGALIQGDYAKAHASLSEGLKLARDASEVHTEGVALAALGELARLQGDGAAAKQRFYECARLAREAATPFPLALALLGLGRLALADASRAARASFEEALAVARDATLAHVVPPCLVGLAQLATVAEDPQAAKRLLDEALNAARRSGNGAGEADALNELGWMASAGGDQRRAAVHYRQSLTLQADIGDPAAIATSLQGLASTAIRTGRFSAAARMLGAAQGVRDAHGCAPDGREQSNCELCVRRARQRLGEPAFEAAWTLGRDMSTAEAIAYASQRRGRSARPAKGWEALTPAQHGVVALAQQGLSNTEIARRLYVSRRTVDAHLAHVYTKLGINSRMQLITAPRPPRDPGPRR